MGKDQDLVGSLTKASSQPSSIKRAPEKIRGSTYLDEPECCGVQDLGLTPVGDIGGSQACTAPGFPQCLCSDGFSACY